MSCDCDICRLGRRFQTIADAMPEQKAFLNSLYARLEAAETELEVRDLKANGLWNDTEGTPIGKDCEVTPQRLDQLEKLVRDALWLKNRLVQLEDARKVLLVEHRLELLPVHIQGEVLPCVVHLSDLLTDVDKEALRRLLLERLLLRSENYTQQLADLPDAAQ